MAKWKLCRQIFGQEYELTEGEDVTVGRGVTNKIVLNGAVISRNHCIINVERDRVLVTDLKSSNGTYINTTKIPPNTPCVAKHSDIIGFGWTKGVPIEDIKDADKFYFKLTKNGILSVEERIEFISDNEVEELDTKANLKRKLNFNGTSHSVNPVSLKQELIANDVIISISDSDTEYKSANKRIKYEQDNVEEEIKIENDDFQFEAFSVKQEYIEYDDAIESDEDLESQTWKIRLSQNSPGKPLTKARVKIEKALEDSSYSQLDDGITYISSDEERNDYDDDLIYIPPDPPNATEVEEKISKDASSADSHNKTSLVLGDDGEDFLDDLISLLPAEPSIPTEQLDRDDIDGICSDNLFQQAEEPPPMSSKDTSLDSSKKAQLIEPLPRSPKIRSSNIETAPPQILSPTKISSTSVKDTSKSKFSTKDLKQSKSRRHSSSKKHISDSHKEERKRKLKEIATKDKDAETSGSTSGSAAKAAAYIKVTASNRGAFLSELTQAVVKPVQKESPEKSLKPNENEAMQTKGAQKSTVEASQQKKHRNESDKKTKNSSTKKKNKHETENKSQKNKEQSESKVLQEDTKNEKSNGDLENKREKHRKAHKPKEKPESSKRKESVDSDKSRDIKPLKSLKPLTDSAESHSGRPVSKVEPLPETYFKKPKKSVRFSEEPPKVIEFQIEPGNRMKKTSLVKTTLVDIQQKPVFSLEKITLMKILRWNPSWLQEQLNNSEPPPILGHNRPTNLYHTFSNHNHYVQAVGDLLLMEIWECLTQAHLKGSSGPQNENQFLQMRVESMPVVPPPERAFDIVNISVNLSLPKAGKGGKADARNVPRCGEILLVYFGPENARTQRFLYVHAVRTLPSPPNNIYAFYTICFQATFTDKMNQLKPGEMMLGKRLAYINNDLNLFEAMEYLAGSPLLQAILRPEPRHFASLDPAPNVISPNLKYTATLNESQRLAVANSVAAALGDRPCLQMVQGPPGTGKSSVICAIVMSYFYDEQERKLPNRGKILICATSNPAVDELVLRLLKIRQSLPRTVRFGMVRVGRAEAMHPRARVVSSQELAVRDVAAQRPHQDAPALKEEISHLEAKINMLTATAQNEKDPARVAYCQSRIADTHKRITMLRGGVTGGGEEPRGEAVASAERRIIDRADIIVTTLASAHSHKLRGLSRRIALCIVDEAGQAIEPETLIPLTLDVTRLTLIGDPQQLPGFICSQRAKQSGLGNSLFSRIASLSEHWPEASQPVVLLNQQYRMQPEIAAYPNRAFYNGQILSCPSPRPNLPIPPYLIVNISSGDKGQVSGANEMEAWGVSRLVMTLHAIVRPMQLDIGVITPYAAHRDKIRLILKALQDPSEPPIEVNTVDSFQGQERDLIVVSLARSQGVGFLTDVGRMNVMLTRAKHSLIVCLNTNAVMKHAQWRTLVEDAQLRRVYRSLPTKHCQSRSLDQSSNDDILKYLQR